MARVNEITSYLDPKFNLNFNNFGKSYNVEFLHHACSREIFNMIENSSFQLRFSIPLRAEFEIEYSRSYVRSTNPLVNQRIMDLKFQSYFGGYSNIAILERSKTITKREYHHPNMDHVIPLNLIKEKHRENS